MSAIKKKICLVGAFAVGKTSLIRRFVEGIFSEEYLTTIGVKIDQKSVGLDDGREVLLMIWDLAGSDEFQSVRREYLRGASGYLAVADGTRRETVDAALEEIEALAAAHPGMPGLLLLNKSDLADRWEMGEGDLETLSEKAPGILRTSARDGRGVEEAFETLARHMLEADRKGRRT
ncbi:MAG: GTP-binding protein [Verrucomicrobiae bacterium]|nr:GTP-binding protein [Verrucomicrobiae bacterium]MCP5551827.1 GTP-binding protein [Akkermansiaceae bacterium]